jgi:hypothetical protein
MTEAPRLASPWSRRKPHLCPRCHVDHGPPDPEHLEKQVRRAAASIAADVEHRIVERFLADRG